MGWLSKLRIGVALLGGCLLVILPGVVPGQTAPFDGVLRGHLGAVFMGVFTPDGERAVTVSSDETARCWDLKTGREVWRFKQHTGPIYSLAVSANGRLLVTGAQDNTLRLWDVPQTRPIWSAAAHPGGSRGLARSPDGGLWISGGTDKSVRLWNSRELAATEDLSKLDLNKVSAIRPGHEEEVTAAAVRNDANLLATGDAGGHVIVWSPFLEGVQGDYRGHTGGVTGVMFHSNNQQLITTGNDGQVRLWQLPPAPEKKIDAVQAVVRDVLIVVNQAVAVVATEDHVARAIDLNNGQVVREFPRSESPITSLAIAPNNSLLAIANEAGQIRLFNFGDAADRGTLTGHNGGVHDIVFHPDNQTLSSGGADGTVRMWKVPPPAEGEIVPVRVWEGVGGGALALAVSTDGARLFAGGGTGQIQQWRTGDGELERTFGGHTAAITELAFLPNSQQLVSTSRDKTLRQWKLDDGTPIRTIEQPAVMTSVSVSNDSQRAATIAEDGVVRVWDITSGLPLQDFSGHAAGTGAVRWLNDNQTFVSGSADKSLRVWKTSIIRTFQAHEKPITDVSLYNGGSHILTCSSDGRIVLSDMNNGQVARTFEGLTGDPRAVALRSDNQRLAAGNEAGKVVLWNANDAQQMQTLEVQGAVTSLAWSNDYQKLAVATDAPLLYFFGPPLPPQSPQPGNELVEHMQVVTPSVLTRIAFDSDQHSIRATQADGNVSQWAYASPLPIRQFNHGGAVFGVAISREGKTIVSCSADQTVRIWDGTNGQQRAVLSGHSGQVLAVALSPDESLIVSSGADRTVRLWDVTGGKQLKQLATLDETMYSVDFHPNGQTIAAGGADRKIHLFNVLSGAEQRVLEGHTDYVHSVRFNANGSKLLSYTYAGDLRAWNVGNGQQLMQQQIGRVGNFASYSPDNTKALLSNGDDTARVIELPAEAR